MQEKHEDLIGSQQKVIIKDVVATLNTLHPSFYYMSTIEVAAEIKKYIHEHGNLVHDKFELVKNLTRHDIQIMLSLHSR